MTLIELIYEYRDMIRSDGREAADKFLYNVADKSIIKDIQSTVADDGNFLDAYGEYYTPEN